MISLKNITVNLVSLRSVWTKLMVQWIGAVGSDETSPARSGGECCPPNGCGHPYRDRGGRRRLRRCLVGKEHVRLPMGAGPTRVTSRPYPMVLWPRTKRMGRTAHSRNTLANNLVVLTSSRMRGTIVMLFRFKDRDWHVSSGCRRRRRRRRGSTTTSEEGRVLVRHCLSVCVYRWECENSQFVGRTRTRLTLISCVVSRCEVFRINHQIQREGKCVIEN